MEQQSIPTQITPDVVSQPELPTTTTPITTDITTPTSFRSSIWYKVLMYILFFSGVGYYVYRYRLPIICYGCDDVGGFSKYIFRCQNDTRKTCNIVTRIEKIKRGVDKSIDATLLITQEVFRELTVHIPAAIKKTLQMILRDMSMVAKLVIKNVIYFEKKFVEYVSIAYQTMKHETISTFNDFQRKVVVPFYNWIITNITEPITELIAKLILFKKTVTDAVISAASTVSGVFVNLTDDVIDGITKLPIYIQEMVNAIITVLNTTINKTVSGINTTTGTVASKISDSTNVIINGLNGIMKGMVSDVNSATSGMTGTLNNALSPVINTINNIITGINKIPDFTIPGVTVKPGSFGPYSLPKTTIWSGQHVSNSINFGVPGIPSIPAIDIPALIIPSTQIIPSFTIPDFTVFTDFKPFGTMPKANAVKPVSVTSPSVKEPSPIPTVSLSVPPVPVEQSPVKKVDLTNTTELVENAISSAYNKASNAISSALNAMMKPINEAISILSILMSAVISSIEYFFMTKLPEVYTYTVTLLKEDITLTFHQCMSILNTYIVVPIVDTYKMVSSIIIFGVNTAIDTLKHTFVEILRNVNNAFNTVSTVLYNTGLFLINNTVLILFISFVNFLDVITFFIPLQKTIKLNIFLFLVLLRILLMFSGMFFFLFMNIDLIALIVAGAFILQYTMISNTPDPYPDLVLEPNPSLDSEIPIEEIPVPEEPPVN